MREIKFRAWMQSAKTGEHAMVYPNDGGCFGDDLFLNFSGDILSAKSNNNFNYDVVYARIGYNDRELMQYTGLKDKNGKEIYEGDILRVLYTDWPSQKDGDERSLEQYQIDELCKVGNVIYQPVEFMIDFHEPSNSWQSGYGSLHPGRFGWLEIIGNIHENPELFK